MIGKQDSILIKNGLVLTMDSQNSVFQGNIYIEDGILKEIGSHRPAADDIIDAAGMLVLPGFVQTHIHLCQVLFRGLADDMDVVDWLKRRIWPLESAHDEESIYASARLGIAELIAGGTTAVMSMETTRYTDGVCAALTESGFRAFCGNAMMDIVEPGTEIQGLDTGESMAESRRLYGEWHGKGGGLLRYAVMPRGARNCSDELVESARRFALDNGLLFHTHVSENGPLSIRLKKETGLGDIELLEKQGVAGPNLVAAHAIWLSDQEIEIVKRRGVKIVHCPSANMKLASGFCKTTEMLNRGISLSLGADGAPCNNNLDMFNEMRFAGLIHKPRCGPASMNALQVLRMATIGGAECLGMEKEIGSLEAGKKADVILLRRDGPHCNPVQGVPPESQIVYSMKSGDVDTTIINGKVLYRGGRFTGMNRDRIVAGANTQAEKLLNRLGGSQSLRGGSNEKTSFG
jgi:cytosine/adenosine deaminase-related metal-dependent hydrolase